MAYMLMSLSTLIPLKLGTLALLAGKALIISKLALALAAIVGLKKLLSGGDGHESSYQVTQYDVVSFGCQIQDTLKLVSRLVKN